MNDEERMEVRYSVYRIYMADKPQELIKTDLTLGEARAWCRDPETSSKTCTSEVGKERTAKYGPWFDGYEVA